MDVALHRPIATGRVGVEPTARVHRQVGGLLHRLHREISGCLDNDSPLATDPRDNGRPVFGLCRKNAFSRQNPKIVYWKIKGLRVQTFLFSVICDRALCTAPREGGSGSGVAFGRQPTRALLHEAVASY